MGYFRKFFVDNPNLVHSTSNEELMARWKQDHPNHSPKDALRARQNLANLKSNLRRQEREQNSRGGRFAARTAARASANTPPRTRLESLEAQIDDCLLMARNLDPVGLANTIKFLRVARNEVVLKLG
jgi:hypothetical protein